MVFLHHPAVIRNLVSRIVRPVLRPGRMETGEPSGVPPKPLAKSKPEYSGTQLRQVNRRIRAAKTVTENAGNKEFRGKVTMQVNPGNSGEHVTAICKSPERI